MLPSPSPTFFRFRLGSLQIDSSKVSPTADFTSDLGLDSLDSVELVIALEDEFDVMIPDGDADKIGSCTAAIDYIDSLKIGTIV